VTVEDGAVGRDTAMARVMVVGCAGSGKSEASRRLARITGLPLIHLDAHFWKPGWTQPDRGDWEQTVDDLAAQPRWIMDGNYSRTLSRRLARADTLIHLDFSTLLCTWRVLKRTWGLGGARANELPAGCSERFDSGTSSPTGADNAVRTWREWPPSPEPSIASPGPDSSKLFFRESHLTTSPTFTFTLAATDGLARTGEIAMPRGTIATPAFMPVGTGGTVKAMYMDQVRGTGTDIILGNTYHLMLRPGAERVARLGGLHEFARWPWPILTDSGGFQVMSLAQLRKLNETGVTFRSHIDGSKWEMTPERSIEIQGLLDSDIQMQLDECVALPSTPKEIERAMELSLRWAERCRTAFGEQPGKAMFGIVQGGDIADLRVRSAQALRAMELKGYAVGGLAVGEPQAVMLDMLDATCPELPHEKPRYLMGVGTPDDIVKSVARGIDMFDCVMPTRAGRHGLAYTRHGKINLRNARHADDPRPLDEESDCPAARDYSRAYLHHLIRSGEALGGMLLTWNNISYYQDLMRGLRGAIRDGRFADHAAAVSEGWARGDLPAR